MSEARPYGINTGRGNEVQQILAEYDAGDVVDVPAVHGDATVLGLHGCLLSVAHHMMR